MGDDPTAEALFDSDGALRLSRFSSGARDALRQTRSLLQALDRHMFLPLDLLIVLIERGWSDLEHNIALGTDGNVPRSDVPTRLRALAREIEEEPGSRGPSFERAAFSRGFTRILAEAHQCALGRRSKTIAEEDLVRCLMWRTEVVESASVRWAIRRLSEGGGDVLFDQRGMLRSELFAESTWSIIEGAMTIAAQSGTPFLGTPHLVAILCSIRSSTIWRSASARGLEPQRLREELLRLIGTKSAPIPEFLVGRKTLTPRMVRMLAFAVKRADDKPVAEQHLVEAFLDDGGSSLELVQALGLESEIRKALGEPKVLEEALPIEAAIRFGAKRDATPTLDMLGRDLTEEALQGRLPEIVGRETELQRVVNILLRKEQRNPLLTGEAGVGKTALAVALAQRIADGKVPRRLQGHRVVEINGASLMSGTSYRGDLESRIKGLLDEASGDVILFMDEAHAVFAPRAGSHAPAEVPNHFKSALASGAIAVVAATTDAEYRRWFEQDPALKRRFERIEVPEPDSDLVRDILDGLAADLESEYDVQVAPDAIAASIDLSVQYLPEQRLPDKAKKLLMDACIARANDLVERDPATENRVAVRDVALQVNMKTGIPLERLMRGEINWWVGLEGRLREKIVGQDDAIRQVARALLTSRLKRGRKHRPMGVLVLLGPPGVGKGTLARLLAEEVFNDTRAVIRLDMTDFQEAHSISRLIGSPPGYVGYEDEDVLVTPLRRRPSSVVLMEDFDRAHHRIQERVVRLLEEGEIADTRGHAADASNALFILTVQTAGAAVRGTKIGFGESAAADDELDAASVLAAHDPEFAARVSDHVDSAILFQDLRGRGGSAVRQLLEQRVVAFVAAMSEEYKIEVTVSEGLDARLENAAAELARADTIDEIIERLLYSPVTEAMLGEGCARRVRLDWDDENERVVVVDGTRDE